MSHNTPAGDEPGLPARPPRDRPSTDEPTSAAEGPSQRPTFPERRLLVRALHDPVLDALGHDPRSAYVEQYWLSVLGPSAILLLRRLANGLDARPDGFELDPAAWSLELGLGARGGKHSPFWRTVERICRFGAAQRNGEVLAVRRRLPPLNKRQIERLPEHLRLAHDRWSQQRLDQPRRRTISQWSERHDLTAPPAPPEDPRRPGQPPEDSSEAA
ncbi:MAG: hypothetical protein OEV40_07330 [Acidimicrobiia bacterium]|nr:hypothetical protein [Acidimicrobiia bacterium]